MNRDLNRDDTAIRIVFLYSTVVGHVVGVLKALLQCGRNTEIDVVFWDRKHINTSRYVIEKIDRVTFHARSSMTDSGLVELLLSRNPDIIYISGWMDRGYLRALGRYRAAGGNAQVVCGIDDQWKGTLKQYLGKIYFRLFYSKLFDFMWVSGKPQYHYAQRFGYRHERIISNLLSADTTIFNRKPAFSRRFVFIGRFVPQKGLDLLLNGYNSLPEGTKMEWPLVLIGDGGLRETIMNKKSEYVVLKPFMQPKALIEELMQGGVACIASNNELWGVAIHEMALLGYPLILSSACGAATEFLIGGYNGFLFKKNDMQSLRDAMIKITSLPIEDLELFSLRSHHLGQRITPEHAAYSLLSVIPLSRI
jgi:glycosyltransferase involved in cell wall biosynthesis